MSEQEAGILGISRQAARSYQREALREFREKMKYPG